MAARPKQHSLLARRAFWGIVLSLLIVLGGLSALLYQAYLGLMSSSRISCSPPSGLACRASWLWWGFLSRPTRRF